MSVLYACRAYRLFPIAPNFPPSTGLTSVLRKAQLADIVLECYTGKKHIRSIDPPPFRWRSSFIVDEPDRLMLRHCLSSAYGASYLLQENNDARSIR